MVFNSINFIFLLLPICLIVYYFLLKKEKGDWAKYWLIVVSLWFYGCYRPELLLWLGGSLLYNLVLLRNMKKWGKTALVLGVMGNLSLLFYCRYVSVIFILGVSFFTFQQISFLVDHYRGQVEKHSISDYILFVLYFPKLLQGPIALHNELLPQFQNVHKIKFNPEFFYRGLVLFTLGMAKKVLLADTLGGAVDYGYTNLLTLHTADALIVILSYSLQLYFDFSGYCDMAMGISRMLGIELPVNFESPYKGADIVEFWKGWHMTLTRFLTRYVYIPLGGSRKGAGRMYINLLLVFLVSGLWHGAGVTFVVWGMLHGLLYVITRMVRGKRQSGRNRRIIRGIQTAGTFLYVSTAWVFFRAASLKEAWSLLQTVGRQQWQKVEYHLAACFNMDEFWYVIKVLRLDKWQYGHYILTVLFLLTAVLIVFMGKNAVAIAAGIKPAVSNTLVLAVLFVWCVLSLSGVSTFLYLNF